MARAASDTLCLMAPHRNRRRIRREDLLVRSISLVSGGAGGAEAVLYRASGRLRVTTNPAEIAGVLRLDANGRYFFDPTPGAVGQGELRRVGTQIHIRPL